MVRRDLISAIVMLATALVFFGAAIQIKKDPFGTGLEPYTFPISICLILAMLVLISLGQAVLRTLAERRESQPADQSDDLRLSLNWVLPMAAVMLLYLGSIYLFQYLLSTVAAFSATLALFGNRGFKMLIAVPVISGILFYTVFFGIFRLLEPAGLIIKYDNYFLFGPLRNLLGV